MKLTLLSTAIILTLSSPLAMAATYRGELNVDYINDDLEGNAGQIGFQWYFQPVTSSFKKIFKKTVSHPLGEAAFLEKSSSLSITYRTQHFDNVSEIDLDNYDFDQSDIDMTNPDGLDLSTTRTAIDYFIPNSIFFIGVEYNRTTLETSEYNNSDLKLNNLGLTAGLMIADNFLVTTNYKDHQDYPLNVSAKYVAELGGGTAVNFLADYIRLDNKKSDSEDGTASTIVADKEVKDKDLLKVSADYYFTRAFSIGTGLLYADKTGYELRARHFFTDAISLRGVFTTLDQNNTYSIGFSARL